MNNAIASKTVRNFLIAFFSVSMLFTLFSCAHMGMGSSPPEVTLSDIQVEDVTLFETTFTVQLRVVNKNPTPIELVGSEASIFLDNSKMLTVVSGDAKSIPGFGSEVIEAEAHASNLKVIPFLARIVSRLQAGEDLKDVDYKANGILHLAGGGMLSGRLPFKAVGQLPMTTIQRLHRGLVRPSRGNVPGQTTPRN